MPTLSGMAVAMGETNELIQILLPRTNDYQERDLQVFDRLAQELTAKFGGVTSYIRAPADGRWKTGRHIERDDIIVIEVMAEGIDHSYWTDLRRRLEADLRQDKIIIRCQPLQLL